MILVLSVSCSAIVGGGVCKDPFFADFLTGVK